MNVNDIYNNGEYLKAIDLDGERHIVTIERVEYRDLPEKDGTFRKKAILFFVGRKKALVCNKINAQLIADGWMIDEADDWVGGQIELRPSTAFFGGQTVPATRVVTLKEPPPNGEPVVVDSDLTARF